MTVSNDIKTSKTKLSWYENTCKR